MSDQNVLQYSMKYSSGYGLTVPDGHIIRIQRQILDYELHLEGGDLLDFGCGNGTHAKWMAENGGWTPWGCDVEPQAIAAAKALLPHHAPNFVVSDPQPDLEAVFQERFDLVLANQVLYYFDAPALERVVDQLHKVLKPGGYFFASMMAHENYYYALSEEVPASDLRRVELVGRLNEVTYVNFKTEAEMVNDFRVFKPLHIGYYDSVIRGDEGSSKHHWFLGKKAVT